MTRSGDCAAKETSGRRAIMAELKTGTWVVVADSEKALILETKGDADYPNLEVRRKETQENPKDIDQSANRPGRFNDGPSPHRSAMGDTDWHELNKERFADDLAEILNARALEQAFDHMVLVAAPSVLGNLRPLLHEEVKKRVIFELDKNLTNQPIDKLETQLRDALKDAA
jgi:protein required for attachment to host cells